MTMAIPPLEEQLRLVFFHSTLSGHCRRVDGFLAQVLQRRRNHGTFNVVRVAEEERPDLLERFKIDTVPTLLVVHDEMDLEPGRLQARSGGGLAGHNGLRSIAAHLKSPDFLRLRVGVGRPGRGDPRKGADYVLSNFTAEEDADALVARAADAVEKFDAQGLERVQAQFN